MDSIPEKDIAGKLDVKDDTDTQGREEIKEETCIYKRELDDLHSGSDFWNVCSYDCLQGEIVDVIKSIQTLVDQEAFDCHIRKDSHTMNNINKQLELRIEDLSKTDCAVVIAGETSSGKSSIINLIIGSDIVPTDIMATTTRVCRIRYSLKMQVTTLDKGGKQLDCTECSSVDQLSEMMEDLATTEDHEIEYIDVSFPVPILKGNIIIVDTPGKGDTGQDDVAEKMMKYLPNAVAFIFVVNVSSAGGFQDDRLLHIIKRVRESMSHMYCLDPEDAIFLLNKWDAVVRQKKKRKKDLYEELKEKVHKIWEGVKDRNILKFASAMVHEDETYKIEFEKSQEILKEVIAKNEFKRVKVHLRFIKSFADDCDLILSHKLKCAKQSTEKTFQELDQFWRDLQVIKIKDRSFALSRLHESVDNFLGGTAKALYQYIHSENFRSRVLQDIEKYSRFTIGGELDARIEKETLSWQQENIQKMFSSEILERLTENFILIQESLHNIKDKMKGFKSPFDVEDKLGSVLISLIAPSGTAVAGSMAMMYMSVSPKAAQAVAAAGVVTGLVVTGLVALDVLDDYEEVVKNAYKARIDKLTQPKIKKKLRKTYEKRFKDIIKSFLEGDLKREIDDLSNSVETTKSKIEFYKEEEKVLLSLSAKISNIRERAENLKNVEIQLD
ncbi:mitofusin-1-like [Saccostrea cucullata]|uniref:mitofusin-1-like n=1 Tax=Saccostrea cuccullata TaxID=36930 RepID=UPI002ED1A466